MKKIVYITGCAGFIGSHLTKKCLDLGWFVYGVDKLSYCSYPLLMEEFKRDYPQQFKFEHIDINNIKHIPEMDILFNICAESHVDNSIENSDEFLKSNINGVHNLLEIIRHKKIRPLFYQMSTDEVYGDGHGVDSHVETDNCNPSNPYSFSKASADLLVKSFARTYGIKYKIGRATNTWGIRQNTEKLIPRTCKNLILNRKTPLHNWGSPIRTWLHVNDCTDAILEIAINGKENEIYNIAGNEEYKNLEIVSKISKLLGDDTEYYAKIEVNPITPVKIKSGDVEHDAFIKNYSSNGEYMERIDNGLVFRTNMNKICDFSYSRDGQDIKYSLNGAKLKSHTGWETKYNLDTELSSVVAYYQTNFIW